MKEMVKSPYSGLFMFYLMFEGGNQYNDSNNYIEEAIKNTEAAWTEVYDTIEYLIGEDMLEIEFDTNYYTEIVGNHPKKIEHLIRYIIGLMWDNKENAEERILMLKKNLL